MRWNELVRIFDKNGMKMASTFIHNQLDSQCFTLMESKHILHASTYYVVKLQVCWRNSLVCWPIFRLTSQLCRRNASLRRRSFEWTFQLRRPTFQWSWPSCRCSNALRQHRWLITLKIDWCTKELRWHTCSLIT